MVSLSDWRESFHFISFVPVWLFQFFSGSFQAVYTKSMYSGPNNILCESHGTLECYLSQTCIHAMLDSNLQYVARVLHFSASSFSTLLGSQEALSYINNAFMNYITSWFHSKSRLRGVVYRVDRILHAKNISSKHQTWVLRFCIKFRSTCRTHDNIL